MKRIIIFCVILILAMTFAFTRPVKIDEENIIGDTELEEYRNMLVAVCEKYEYPLTEEQIDQEVQAYKERKISIAKANAEGMDVIPALIISLITCGGLLIVRILTFLHRRELYSK